MYYRERQIKFTLFIEHIFSKSRTSGARDGDAYGKV